MNQLLRDELVNAGPHFPVDDWDVNEFQLFRH